MASFEAAPVEAKSTMSSATSSPPIPTFIWLKTSDGTSQEVERELTRLCPLLNTEILQNNRGISETSPVVLPGEVDPSSLGRILEYCRFLLVPDHSDEEHSKFERQFDELGRQTLSNLVLAATSLDMEPLVRRLSLATERKVKGVTPEEVRESLQLPKLTEKRKLQHDKISTGATPHRSLHKPKAASVTQSDSVEGGHRDDRSIDDLLAYIEGGEEEGKETKKARSKKGWWIKKKNIEKEQQARDYSSSENSTDDWRDSQEANIAGGETDIGMNDDEEYDSAELDDDDTDNEMVDIGTQTSQ